MSDSQEESEEPKIIVDTDWKEQVAREKEAADRENVESEAPVDGTPINEAPINAAGGDEAGVDEAGSKQEVSDGASTEELPPAPPATFEVLISMLFTQAMAMLGQMPDPGSGETRVNKPYAKHYIDTLDMLSEKTSGNLSDSESKMLSEALHALRMMYVNTKA